MILIQFLDSQESFVACVIHMMMFWKKIESKQSIDTMNPVMKHRIVCNDSSGELSRYKSRVSNEEVDVSQKKRLSDESTIDGSQRKRRKVIYHENEGYDDQHSDLCYHCDEGGFTLALCGSV